MGIRDSHHLDTAHALVATAQRDGAARQAAVLDQPDMVLPLSLIHISEPTRPY